MRLGFKKIEKDQGFSLVEVLVAFVLLGFMLATVLHICQQSLMAWQKIEQKDDVQHSLRVALDRISRDIRQAALLHSSCTGEVLVFYNPEGEIIQYSLSQGTLYRKSGTASKVPVVNNINALEFIYLPCGSDISLCRLVQIDITAGSSKIEPIKMSTKIYIRTSAGNE